MAIDDNLTVATPRAMLEAALEKEEHAYHFYAGLLTHGPVGLLRELIEGLRDEEYRHIQSVKTMLADLDLGKEIL
jgi:rubrerythrin